MDSMFNTPQEVVQANMNGAVKRAATSKKKVFFMGIMAGVCIALGAQSSNVAMHDISNVGLARLVAGCVFPVGLMMIVFIGGELFTGDCMMTMACIKRKISVASLIRTSEIWSVQLLSRIWYICPDSIITPVVLSVHLQSKWLSGKSACLSCLL